MMNSTVEFTYPQGSAIIKIQSLLADTVWDTLTLQNLATA